MSMIMIKVPKDKTMELKKMISEGLHIFGRAMSLAEEMCEGADLGERLGNGDYGDRMGERMGGYGDRMGMREPMGERHYPQYPMMGERDYEYMGERRGRSSMTGRYTSY